MTNYGWAKHGLSLKTTLNLIEKRMYFFLYLPANDYICVVERGYSGVFWPANRNCIINDKS